MVQQASSPGNDTTGRPTSAWITRFGALLCGSNAASLAGLSFAVKDNIDVAGVPTTAGCPGFAYTPERHATVVQRLLDSGASLAGKTNLDQFACGLNGTRSPYGAVPNAFDARLVSGGSSSGSAYVVATGQVDFALGTDTAGSGRVPAGLNNIVGLKPSRGLISARGVVPAAQSVDCVSIFARSVGLAARVLHAAVGLDRADPYSRVIPMMSRPWPRAVRLGVPAAAQFHGDTQSAAAWEEALDLARTQGARLVEIDFAPFAEVAALLYESPLVAERLAAIRGFFDAHESEIIEPVRGIIASGRRYSAAEVFEAQTLLHSLAQRIAPLWDDLDALCVPTTPIHVSIAAMRADPVGLNRVLGQYTNFVNLLDYAALAIPAGMRGDGLPFGITLIAPAGNDWRLAELGQRLHHASGLAQGALDAPLPAPIAIPGLGTGASASADSADSADKPRAPAAALVRVAVVGAHLSGMPLNSQLIERAARLVQATTTAPVYRLYALPDTVPPKPGMLRVATGGTAIAVEVWEMPMAHYGSFVAAIPAPLGIGTLELADGSSVQGFLCEPHALEGATDISAWGGWRAWVQRGNQGTDGTDESGRTGGGST